MKKEEYQIREQDKFLAENKKRFERGNEDKEFLTAKKQTMQDITKDITGMPEKLHILGELSKPSQKPHLNGENPMQGGEAKNITPESITPQRSIDVKEKEFSED